MRLLIFIALEALIVLVIILYLGNPIPWIQKQFVGDPDTREVVASPQHPSPPTQRLAASPSSQDAAATEHHPVIPSSQCFAPPTRALSDAAGPRVYRWEDEQGQVNFGDRPPAGAQTSLVTPSSNEPRYFLLDVREVGQRQMPYLRGRVETNSRRIFQAFRGFLGEARLRQVEMDITIFEHRQEFHEHARRTGAGRSANVLGYYRLPENAVYTFQQGDDSRTLDVATHEVVHVIVAGLLGPTTPLWLNEGLATYFSGIEVTAQYGMVPPDRSRMALAQRSVRNGYPRRLIDFLEQDRSEWNNRNNNVHYALGWALTYFLLGSDEGRFAITALMQMKADAFCERPDHRSWLARFYPGGVNGLQRDFYGWLASGGELLPHQY